MSDIGSASVGLGIDTSGFQSGLKSAAGLLGGFGVGALAVGASLVAAGVAFTKQAADYDAGVKSLVTGAGESQKNLGMVSDGMLQIARDTGTTTSQLTSGLYMIESAGFHGAAGLAILKDAAEGAKVGNADLGVVADATTTILNDFGKTGITSANAVNLLIQTVASGKTHMEDLAGALSQILPTASAAKVSLTGVMAAMATMTAEGIPAANAATYLRQTIIGLDAPGSKAVDTLKSIGLSTQQVSTAMQQSLPGAVQLITDALAKKFPVGSAAYLGALKDIAGGSKTMQGLLDLSGDHLKTFQDNLASLTGGVKAAGNSITGWNVIQGEFNFKLSQAKEAVETFGIQIGTKLLPFAMQAADLIGSKLTPVITIVGQVIDQVTRSFDAAQHAVLNFAKPIQPLKNLFDESAQAASRLGKPIGQFEQLFDEGSLAVARFVKPIQVAKATFDEGSLAVAKMTAAAKPFAAAFDEGGRYAANFNAQLKATASPAKQISTAILSVATIAQKEFIPAFENAVTLFDKDVLPSLSDFAIFTAKNVLPVVEKFGAWIATKMMPPVIQLVGVVIKDLVPVLKTVWGVIATNVIPVVEQVGSAVATKMLPPLEGIISKVGPVLTPILRAVGWVLTNVVGPGLSTTIGFVGGLLTIIDNAIGKIGDFLGLLGQVKDGAQNIGNVLHNAHVPGFAVGTAYAPGGLALVGERGPELVDLPQGSRVHDAAATSAMATKATGGGNHYHYHAAPGEGNSVNKVMTTFRRMELLHV